MVDKESTPPRRPIVHIFDAILEIAVSTLPLVLVVIGIGMMSFSPRRSSVPLFRSPEQALEFFKHNGITPSPAIPIVLIKPACPTCSTLTSALKEHGISFREENIESNPAATALWHQTEKVTGSKSLPQVILGEDLVHPAPYSIKIAVRRLSNRQKTSAQ